MLKIQEHAETRKLVEDTYERLICEVDKIITNKESMQEEEKESINNTSMNVIQRLNIIPLVSDLYRVNTKGRTKRIKGHCEKSKSSNRKKKKRSARRFWNSNPSTESKNCFNSYTLMILY